MPDSSKTPLLDRVRFPSDLKNFSLEQLRQLADELRSETINVVSHTGGHLGAGLGVVELTVALHTVFDTPDDKLIWDVGHQAYPHKILTGRRDRIRTLRQGGGLSGFTKRTESEYDPFGAAHSSTSISAGLGMAVARDLAGKDFNVICVIGDGAMSAGMAYEAMNNAGARNERLIVILNDNDMSIAPPVGAMSAYLARLAGQLVGNGKAERGGDRGRRVRSAERIVLAFAALGEAGQAAALTQGADAIAPAGDDLVRIGLVADVPDQPVGRRVKDIVEGDCQLDDAKPRTEMAAGPGDGVDHLIAQLIGELPELVG